MYCPYAKKIKKIGNIFCIVNILVGAVLTFFMINDEDLCIFALAIPLVTTLNCAIYPFIIGFAYIVANHEIKLREKYKRNYKPCKPHNRTGLYKHKKQT